MGKIYLFFALSKTDGRVPSRQGVPTTCFSAVISPGTSGHFGCAHRIEKFRPLVGGGGGGGGGGGLVRRRKNGCGSQQELV